MKNSTYLIFSIIKNLEKITFKTLNLCDELDNIKIEMLDLKHNKPKWKSRVKKSKKIKQQILDSLNVDTIINDIFKPTSRGWFNKSSDFVLRPCKRIFNDIENSYYNHNDFIICYLHESLFFTKVKLSDINYKRIKEVKSIFTKKQYNMDKMFVNTINDDLKLKNTELFFEINNTGDSIIYNLIKNNYVSIMFYLFFIKKVLTKTPENIILKTKEYLHFERLNNIILKILK